MMNNILIKTAFIAICVFFIFFAAIIQFVIMYKGWGQSVKSWCWMLFLWALIGINCSIKDYIIKKIKKL
jgi:hypothetical protein